MLCNGCLERIFQASDEEGDLKTLVGDANLYHGLSDIVNVVGHVVGVLRWYGAEFTKDALVVECPLDYWRILS